MAATNKKTFHGPCMWPGCPERGVYFTGRRISNDVKWGYACKVHERIIARENLEREREEALSGRRSS